MPISSTTRCGRWPAAVAAAVAAGLRGICTAPGEEAALDALAGFAACELGRKYPQAVKVFEDAWDCFIPFLAFSPPVRKLLYTTSSIESLNYQLRKVTRARGHFPSGDAVVRLPWLAIINIEGQARPRASRQKAHNGQAQRPARTPHRALLGYRYKVPKDVIEAVEDSPEFRAEVATLAARLELTEPEAAGRARAALDGLVASMSPIAVDLLSGALRPLHAHAWDVQADTAGLDRLRELNRRHALVFLPSHRSYADPLLLADVLAEHDFPRNHVLSGDNLRFWPIGPLARRAGIVFIRRSLGWLHSGAEVVP
jgi:Transposase, Mutator family/Acyltransferase